MVKLLQALKDLGIDAVIAGGAVRDQIRGVEPTDIDIWLLGDTSAILPAMLLSLLQQGRLVDLSESQYDAIPVDHLIKGNYQDGQGIWRKVDIIIPTHHYKSPVELVSSFDYSINQGFVGIDCGVYKPDLTRLYVVNDTRITDERTVRFQGMVDMYNQQKSFELGD